MAKKCVICEKGSIMSVKRVKLRGKYNPTGKYRKQPNIQWVTIPIEIKSKKLKKFAGQRIKACTSCIKSIGKTN